ncbi:MAG TPA: hypothetical protein VFR87_01960 [Nocardioidaceae bacterium]|nr:hypothetical protein [Nocardioidaceae bacterium]
MTDRRLLGVASVYTLVTAYGAVVSLRRDVPGEAFGIPWPDRVPMTLAVGMGSGTSAPWPMPLATLVAAIRADGDADWPGKVCIAVGWSTVVGTLGEPATWGKHGGSWDIRSTAALNVLCGLALVTAGRRYLGGRALPVSF